VKTSPSPKLRPLRSRNYGHAPSLDSRAASRQPNARCQGVFLAAAPLQKSRRTPKSSQYPPAVAFQARCRGHGDRLPQESERSAESASRFANFLLFSACRLRLPPIRTQIGRPAPRLSHPPATSCPPYTITHSRANAREVLNGHAVNPRSALVCLLPFPGFGKVFRIKHISIMVRS
jgi:hypothetical protein